MKMKRIIPGLNNSQKIRVIVNGVGFVTTVEGMTHMVFTEQRVAVWSALTHMANQGIRGFASAQRSYDSKMQQVITEYQVDILD